MLRLFVTASLAAMVTVAVLTIAPRTASGYDDDTEYTSDDEAEQPRFRRPPPVRLSPPSALRRAPVQTQALELPGWSYYGWNFFLLDGASGIMAAVGAYPLLVFTYFAGPPIIHIAHERGWVGFASFWVRIAAPAIGAGIGYRLSPALPDDAPWYEAKYVVHGVVLGAVAALLTDAFAFSWEPRHIRRLDAMVVPMPVKDGAGLALGGVF